MKTIKTLMALSALAVVGTANATIWPLEMNSSIYFPTAAGPLNLVGFYGTYDDVSNTGSWSGTATIPTFDTTLHYTQTFTMDETTGLGKLNPYDLAACTANTSSACQGFQSLFRGVLKNTAVNPTNLDDYKNNLPFTPTDGWSGQWVLQLSFIDQSSQIPETFVYTPLPMNVCMRGWTECPAPVPIPSTAWLFGSALMGILTTARKRFI